MAVSLRLALVVGASLALFSGVLGCARDDDADDVEARARAAERVDTSALIAGDPEAAGEQFHAPEEDPVVKAARLQAEKQERAARKATMLTTLPKAPLETLWATADKEEAKQNWKVAEDNLRAFALTAADDKRVPLAVERAMQLAFRRGEYGEGLRFYDDVFLDVEEPVLRARYARLLSTTMLSVPHYGVTRGGEFLRGGNGEGERTQTYAPDRKRAIALLEEARALLATQQRTSSSSELEGLRIAVDFELVTALAHYTHFDPQWRYWWSPWWAGGVDDGTEADVGDDEQADRRGRVGWRGGYRSWENELQQVKPRGIPVDGAGNPIFSVKPDRYEAAVDDTARIKFLVGEIGALDSSELKQEAARSLMLQAMLFRARDGTERLDRLHNWWFQGGRPYQADVEKFKAIAGLSDDEVVTLLATHVAVVKVPADESVPRLLAKIIATWPKTSAADDAAWLLGQLHQSRLQYAAAGEDYEAYLKNRPAGAHVGAVNSAKATLRQPLVQVLDHGPQPAGRPAVMRLKHRNVETLEVTAVRLDLEKSIQLFQAAWKEGRRRKNSDASDDDDGPAQLLWRYNSEPERVLKKLGTSDRLTFTRTVHPAAGLQTAEEDVATEIKDPGLWAVEVRGVDKQVLARTLIGVERYAVVSKVAKEGTLAWVTDAATGAPVEGADVNIFSYWNDWSQDRETRHSKKYNQSTNSDGIAIVEPRDHSNMIWAKKDGVISFPVGFWTGRYGGDDGHGRQTERVAVMMSDRTVYRPEDTVQLKLWARHKVNGEYQPATAVKRFWVRVVDPRGAEVMVHDAPAGEWGSTSLSVTLKPGAPLGAYALQVRIDGNYADVANGRFSVEEYKAPEFEVTVSSANEARLGEVIPVKLEGKYLSGGGVAGGKAHYKIYRQDHTVQWSAPGPWDWLYGRGYGRVWYNYQWFPWWRDCVPGPIAWYPWWGPRPEAPRELVKEGEGILDKDGVLKIELDTRQAKADHSSKDHKYTVVADVVDPSRRLVKGEGEVIVTRSAFLAVIEADTTWSDPGKDLSFGITTIRPDGSLFAAEGKLVVEQVSGFGDDVTMPGARADAAPLVVKKVEDRAVKTDTVGPTRVSWRAPATGQYRVSFVAKDKAGADVRSSVIVWAYGPDFNGALVRTADLEILADKRTYAVGDVARLLVHTDSDQAAVLFATRVSGNALVEWQVIRTSNKSAVVTVPITAAHVPNFFVEASTVKGARLTQEARELHVPPVGSELLVRLTVDKVEHKPGEEASLVIKTTDKDGKPVSAEVAVSVFDQATLQIQPDTMPDVRAHFWGRKRTHSPSAQTSLSNHYQSYHHLYEPFQHAASTLQSFAYAFFQHPLDYRRADTSALRKDQSASFATLAAAVGGNEELGLEGAGVGGGGLGTKGTGTGYGRGEGKASAKAPAAEMASADSRASRSNSISKREAVSDEDDRQSASLDGDGGDHLKSAGGFAPVVRSNFADTAFFSPSIVTDASGTATVKLKFPDNTTSWKVKAVGMDAGARAGRGDATFVTTKKLLVRLAAPRFFREKDTVTLSAIVQNRYPKERVVDVSLDLKNAVAGGPALLIPRGAIAARVTVGPGEEKRVDFVVGVTGEGKATVRVTAKGGDDGDAKELSFPVLVHGMEKTVSSTGSIAVGGTGKGVAEKSFEIEVPNERRPEQTVLTVRTSPSLSGAMIDALPYLLDYPYGCTEQTLARFVPAVLTRRALQQAGGVKLEDLAAARANLNAQQLTAEGKVDKDRLAREAQRWGRNPIYNTKVLNNIIDVGLARVSKMQHSDGGWGWWTDDESSVYMTALVLNALQDAQDADLPIDQNMVQRGRQALIRLVAQELYQWRRHHEWVSDSDAFAALVMARFGDQNEEMQNLLYERRVRLSPYGKLLLARAFHRLKKPEKATLLLQNAEQNVKEDKENETAFIETRTEGWWYWWNDDIETNAAYVRALDEIRKGDARTPLVVKWLLNRRKHGWYWDSTRDTASVIAALSTHMQASGERNADYDLEILVDGKVRKQVHVDKKNLYAVNGDLTLEGHELSGGKHTVTIRRTGEGAVYFNSYLSFFTLEDDIKAAGLEIKVDRQYFKLERQDRVHTIAGDRGQDVASKEVRYKKTRMASGADIKSGDLLLVELMVTSKNDYTDLAFEDPKPAGAEPVALRSGTVVGEGVSHMELRDDKVVFFLPQITQGKLKLTYRLRAEIPGKFSAMPTKAFAMYAPEIKANSDEMKMVIHDVP
ncbi:MAG: alpha-2-macroglobulin family protein [Deltaproteobacteria bacterium]|nr:alpha-2-macroglobulin family protein [Deltaproteobacteria bacterium]